MRVLVVYGSKRGGTERLARQVATTLTSCGHAVELRSAAAAVELAEFDAVVIGGALYAGLWHRAARRFARRHVDALQQLPVWLFSSGPLDDSASQRELPPTPAVARIQRRLDARGHATFGGRLARDAHGFIAHAMAEGGKSGDFRDMQAVDAWARRIADALARAPVTSGHAPLLRDRALRIALQAVAWFVGVTAVTGGVQLLLHPHGGDQGLTPALLAHSPFRTFVVPGVLLLGVVGLGNAAAAWLVAARHRLASTAAFVAGGATAVWIAVEYLLIQSFSWLQVVYLSLGLATQLLALAWARRRLAIERRRAAAPLLAAVG